MTLHRKPLGFVPARGGSKRLARKNIASLNQKPLIAWTIESALQSGLFDTVFVSSEDDQILAEARRWGATALKRNAELAGDTATILQLCLHELPAITKGTDYTDLYLLCPTSPFRQPATLLKAWDFFTTSEADTLMSVVPCQHPPQWTFRIDGGWLLPFLPADYDRPRQELEPTYLHDGGHLITKLDVLYHLKTFVGSQTIPFPVPIEEAVDINEPIDLVWAEFLLEKGDKHR